MSQTETLAPPAKSRLGRLDVLRGIALIAMATYHWGLEDFLEVKAISGWEDSAA